MPVPEFMQCLTMAVGVIGAAVCVMWMRDPRPRKHYHRALGTILQADLRVTADGSQLEADGIIVEYADERGKMRRDSFPLLCDTNRVPRVPSVGAAVHVVWERGTDPADGTLEMVRVTEGGK